MQIQITEAIGDECLTVHRLWQLFMHDISEFYGNDVDAQGVNENISLMEDDDTFHYLTGEDSSGGLPDGGYVGNIL